MVLSVAQLSEHLIRSGLLPEEQIKASAQSVSGLTEESSAESLAKQLVRDGRLTLFQAQLAVNGKAAALVLGSYLILEKLGQGGMGQVYKARHRTMKREVALKVISSAVVKDETSLRRFQREVEAAAQLNHPNIVTAHDAGEHKGTHFLVMELVRGSDLASMVKKSGPMKASKAVECILQAARGLAYAHSNGIVHRDIKPANLLLDESGTIKILDMGLARFEEAGEDHASVAGLTGTGMLMGTIDYMSPEQAMDSKTADARSDIYSLGCTLYFLLTGQAVYVEDTVMKRIMAHQAAALPQLPILDSRLQVMFERMIAKKPEQRYQSTTELANELQSWLTSVESDRVKATAEMPVAGGGSWYVPEDSSFRDAPQRPTVVTLASPSEQRGDTTPGSSATDATIVPQSGTTATNPLADSPAMESASSSDMKTVQRGSQTSSGPKKTLKRKAASTNLPVAFADISPAINTSIDTSKPSRTKEVGSSSRPQTTFAKSGSQPPRRIWTAKLVAACGGGALCLLLGIIVIRITGKDGTESVIKVPEGTQVSVDPGTGGRVEISRVPDDAAKVDSAGSSHQPSWDGWPKDGPAPAIAPFDSARARKHQEEWAAYLKVPVEYTNSIGMKFVLIPPGEFTMGMTKDEAETLAAQNPGDSYCQELFRSSSPEHRVRLTQAWYMGMHEVTQEQYATVMGINPSSFSATGADKDKVANTDTKQYPVEMVTSIDAMEFCIKLSKAEKLKPVEFNANGTITLIPGHGYSLPTEAEWEHACRAGTNTAWFAGEQASTLGTVAWFGGNSGAMPHGVGQLKSNSFGLYDMHGNVWEWCHDWHAQQAYSQRGAGVTVDPRGPDAGSSRVARGGNWYRFASCCRSDYRGAAITSYRSHDVGFRVSLPVDAVRQGLMKQGTMSPQPAWDGWQKDGPAPAIAPFDAAQARKHQEEWATYLKVPVEYKNSLGMKFVLIPPGEFTMGSTSEEITEALQYVVKENTHWQQCVQSEEPRHKVVLTQPFYLGVNEITQGEYTKVMGMYPSHPATQGQGKEQGSGITNADLPVHYVTWNEAAEFCAKLSEQEKFKPFYSRVGETIMALDGAGYRLPSEAEWEFACRAGTVTKYWTGDRDVDMLRAGWCAANSAGRRHTAGELEANPFGLSNIHGNMREWVQDGWDTSFYSQFKDKLAVNPDNPYSASLFRVNRGGSWHAPPSNGRSADRYCFYATQTNDDIGFRVSLTIDPVREAMERANSDLTMQPENKNPATAAEATGAEAAMLASEGTPAGSPAVAKNEAMTPDASGAGRSASNGALSVAGTLAPAELRLKERSADLPPFKSVLRPGQPLGEFAAVSSPGKVENIISWSIEPVMHRFMFRCIDVSSEGLIATGGIDNSVRIWTKDWQLLKILPGHANILSSVAFSPDGKQLASISNLPHSLLALWDVSSGQLLQFHETPNWNGRLAWLPDGKTIARGGEEGPGLINPWSGEKRIGKRYSSLWIDVSVSPDGRQLVYTDEKGSPQIVDLSSLDSIRTIENIGGGYTDWSRDGKWIVVTNEQRTMLIDSRSFQVRTEFAYGGLARFSPDSTMLAVASSGGISVRDTQDWSELRKIPLGVSYDFAWSADGRQLHSSNGSADVTTGQPTPHPMMSATTPVVSAVSSDGRDVATIANFRLRLFDGSSGKLKIESTLEHWGANQLLWQPQGKKILRLLTSTESIPAPLVLIDSESGKVAHTLNGHQGAVWRTAWSPDGTRCASVGEDATCRIWDAASGAELQKLTHSDPLWWVQWSGDGTKIATGSSFSVISVWDVASGKLVREFKTLSKPMSAPRTVTAADGPFGFLKGDTQLFYMAGDSGFEVLDLTSGQITSLGQVDHIGGNRLSAGWSKDFGLLGIYGGYNEFHMYAAGDSKPVISIRYFVSPHWLADGRRLLGGDNSSTWLAGYDLRRKRRMGVLIPELAANSWAVISGDGNLLGADDAKDHMVVVAMHRDGRLLTMTLDEFQTQFNWTNNPEKVRFLD